MKNKDLKARTTQVLLQIHRGFLPEPDGPTDLEVLSNVPEDGLVPKQLPNDESILVQKPFTYKWVYRRLKKDPTLTSYDMLVEAGFKEPDGS